MLWIRKDLFRIHTYDFLGLGILILPMLIQHFWKLF